MLLFAQCTKKKRLCTQQKIHSVKKNISTSHHIYRNPIAFEGRTRLDTSNDAQVNGDSIAGDSKWDTDTKKERARVRMCPRFVLSPLVRGGYLLSHFRSTIGVTRLNFSVRNGKRWDPRAIATLVFFFRHALARGRL